MAVCEQWHDGKMWRCSWTSCARDNTPYGVSDAGGNQILASTRDYDQNYLCWKGGIQFAQDHPNEKKYMPNSECCDDYPTLGCGAVFHWRNMWCIPK